MASFKLGRNAVAERKTGPSTWDAIDNIRDLTLNLDSAMEDATVRGSGGWEVQVKVLRTATVTFEMNYDPNDDHVIAFQEAYLTNDEEESVVPCRFLDGPGGAGIVADWQVKKFEMPQPIRGVQRVSIELVPAPTDVAPSWKEADPPPDPIMAPPAGGPEPDPELAHEHGASIGD